MSENGMDEIKALRAEFQAKDEAYEREFKRINHALGDIRTEFAQGIQALAHKLDQRADASRITLPLVLSAIGTFIAISTIAGVIHNQSLKPLYMQDSHLKEAMAMSHSLEDEKIELLRAELYREIRHIDEKKL